MEMDALTQKLNSMKQQQTHSAMQDSQTLTAGIDVCPVCNGLGWIPVIEDGVERYTPCECYKKAAAQRKLRFADIPEKLKSVKLTDLRLQCYLLPESRQTVKAAWSIVKLYLENFEKMQAEGNGLYIYSREKGSGKTFFVAAIANELLKEHTVKFATSSSILNEIRNTYNRKSECVSENELINQLCTVEILVIDDFGQERVTDWANDKLYDIVNYRYLNRLVTIYTSNESIGSLEYDSRITSRMEERAFEVQYAEESVRKHIAEQKRRELLELSKRA